MTVYEAYINYGYHNGPRGTPIGLFKSCAGARAAIDLEVKQGGRGASYGTWVIPRRLNE